MKTVQENWQEYRDRTYQRTLTANRNRELQMAYFAGAFAALSMARKISELPEAPAKAIDAMIEEIGAAALYGFWSSCPHED